jgi:hypothetical protein
MGLLKYIVSLPFYPRASIIASMLANISTIMCCCDDVLTTEPHIESQLQFLSTVISACGAYATLSTRVDCISPRQPASLLSTFWSSAPAYSAAACLTPLTLLLQLVPLLQLASLVCVTPLASLLPMRRLRRLRRLLAPHFVRPCYRVCHLRRLRRRDACGAAWQPSLLRCSGPQR